MKTLQSYIQESGASGCVICFMDNTGCENYNEFWNNLEELLKDDGYYEGDSYDIEDDTSSTPSYEIKKGECCHAAYLRFHDYGTSVDTFANNPDYTYSMDIEDCTDEF